MRWNNSATHILGNRCKFSLHHMPLVHHELSYIIEGMGDILKVHDSY